MTKVILQQAVENVGSAGDIVNVSEGYARNFLFPRKLALAADERNLKEFEHNKRVTTAQVAKLVTDAKGLATKLETHSCYISRKSGEEDKIFGSVTNRDIEETLEKDGIKIDKKQILLAEPIKMLGVFTVPIRLHKDVTANLKRFYVIKED